MLDLHLTEVIAVTGRLNQDADTNLRDIRVGPPGTGMWTEEAPVQHQSDVRRTSGTPERG